TAAGAGLTFSITFKNTSGAMSPFQAPDGTYPFAGARMTGSFRGAGAFPSAASSCLLGELSPCVRLKALVSGVVVNSLGLASLATVSVPCSTIATDDSVCGVGGFWSASGSFATQEGAALTCAGTTVCSDPLHKKKLIAQFSAAGDVLAADAL